MPARGCNSKRVCLRSRSSLCEEGQWAVFDVAPHECSFVVLSQAKVTTGIPLSHQLSHELLPSSSSYHDIPTPGFSIFWLCLPCPESPFPSPSSQRSSIFHSHTGTEISLQPLSLEIEPYCCVWCTWSPLLSLTAWEIKTGIKRWEKSPHHTGRKRSSSPEHTQTPSAAMSLLI